MKRKIKRMIEAKEAKLAELREKSKKSEDVAELRSLNEDIDGIVAELNELKKMYGEMDEPADGAPAGEGERSGKVKAVTEHRGGNAEQDAEARAQAFAKSGEMRMKTSETRAVLLSGGKIATPTGVGEMKDAFNAVSSIVDLVNVVDCEGMGSNTVPYMIADAEADKQAADGAYNESDPEFDFVKITPEVETVVSYIDKQVKKQSPVNYEAKVKTSAHNALRKKAGAVIVDKLKASELVEVLTVNAATIDAGLLRKIALTYGGDENVAGNAVLFLNKKDLIAFGDVRGQNEKKAVYEITPDASNPNTGIIKDGGLSVKYCICSRLTALSTATKGAEAIKTMFYGNPKNFELDLFGDYEIEVSADEKFSKGQLSIRGDVSLGGDVVVDKGFVAVTLSATA